MGVARNVVFDPPLLPGGSTVEMAVCARWRRRRRPCAGVEQWPYRAVGVALEVIPRTLAQNCGANVIRTLTKLRAKHAEADARTFGVDGDTGPVTDMKQLGVWEPYAVKVQTIKTAVESAAMLLRIDDIVSGLNKKRLARAAGRRRRGDERGRGRRCGAAGAMSCDRRRGGHTRSFIHRHTRRPRLGGARHRADKRPEAQHLLQPCCSLLATREAAADACMPLQAAMRHCAAWRGAALRRL
jgi:hypothetical protein